MKIFISATAAVFLFFLIPFAQAGFEEKVKMEVSITPTLIEPLQRKNIDLKNKAIAQKASISWKIKNDSDITLNKKNHVFYLTYGRVGENQETVVKEIHKTIPPGKTVKGITRHKFLAIIGSSGDYGVHLRLSEISSPRYTTPVKDISFPFQIVVPDSL